MSGVRVVRGPDWDWGDQDGGEGFVGTVVWKEEGSGKATVQWDTANRHSYCCGYGGKYDLRVLDTAPAGVQHEGWSCSWCSVSPITGTLWRCVQCPRYSLCSQCYHSGKHCLEHQFQRLDTPDTSHRPNSVRVGSRMVARRVESQGIFTGAVVMRGADWRWEDQDGGIGCQGKVSSIEGWEKTSFRSVAQVMWSHSQVLNLYCIGHNGLVDLQCVKPASGGLYYPEHLPILGEESSDLNEGELRTGDTVRVELDPGEFKSAQEGHGGWEDFMAEYIGCDGVVHAIHYSGDVVVRYKNGVILEVNSQCLSKVEGNSFQCGDAVRVSDDMALVHQLQAGHGEWADDIALSLGQVGRVMKVKANGDIRVAVSGSRWILNPKCLSPAPGDTPIEEKTGELHVDLIVRIQTLSLSDAGCSDLVVVAAAGGDLDTLTKYLRYHPEHVDTVYEGRTAIHAAAMEGYLPIIKLLISHRANLNKKNEGELTALQLCAIVNSVEGAKLLVDGGADPNIGDDRGITPLARAGALGYLEIVKLLLDHHRTNPNKQDCQGSTPLHRAIANHQLQSMIALLNAGADPTISNHSLQNCMHRAAALGFLAGVEELMKWHPDLINKAKKDGFTPLHMAVVNGHTDIVSVLLSHPSCEVNVDSTDGLTPLHLAAHGGQTAMLERLVGYGADLNCATREGNTALHLTLARKNMAAPSPLSPHILEVKKELDQLCGQDTLQPEVVVGVFLVREGAKIHAANRLGLHPLCLQPPDVVQLFTRYSTAVDSRPLFHGTLRQKVGPFADIPPKTPRKQLKVVTHEETSSSSTISSTPPTASLPPTSPLPTSPPLPSSSSSSLPPVTPVPSTSGVDRSVNEYTPSPVLTYGKDINPYAKLAAASAIDSVVSGKFTLDQCSLCEDEPVSIMLQPCGHVTLCVLCGSRAKRCMKKECREEVVNIIKLCPVCLKNKADVTHAACRKDHHRLCRVCAARSSSVCVLCSSVVLRAPE